MNERSMIRKDTLGSVSTANIQGDVMRRKAKVDNNQSEFVNALRNIGASVFITSTVGNGFPDLIVGYKDKNFLIEVKGKYGKLTSDQLTFASRWKGQLVVCRDLSDLAHVLGLPDDYFDRWNMKTIRKDLI